MANGEISRKRKVKTISYKNRILNSLTGYKKKYFKTNV